MSTTRSDRRDLHGTIKPARLGSVDGHHLRCAALDDFDHVVRIPGALVSHHRRIDGAGDLCHLFDAPDRLLEIFDPAAFDPAKHLDGGPGRRVALVCIDADVDSGTAGIADAPHHLYVAIGIDADLDLDGADALLDRLGRFALALGEIHKPQ
jgi:hypothetical protein